MQGTATAFSVAEKCQASILVERCSKLTPSNAQTNRDSRMAVQENVSQGVLE